MGLDYSPVRQKGGVVMLAEWSRSKKMGMGLGLLLLTFIVFVTLRWPDPPPLDEANLHLVPSGDGWEIALHHRPPCGGGPCDGPGLGKAVILCHGLSGNRFTYEMGEGRSLGKYLANLGFDAWLLELRGHGMARGPTGSHWTLTDYVEEDIPAAINYVRATSKVDQVQWVGHSMGGLVLYGYLAANPSAPISAAVTLGAPGHMLNRVPVLGFLTYLMGVWAILPEIPGRIPARFSSTLSAYTPLTSLVWSEENVSSELMQSFLRVGVEDLERGELTSFYTLYSKQRFVTPEGRDYEGAYGTIHTPIAFGAGSVDRIAPPDAVRHVHDRIGSAHKVYRIFGSEQGEKANYGHGDLVLGDRVQQEVFPFVSDWLLKFPPSSAGEETNPAGQ